MSLKAAFLAAGVPLAASCSSIEGTRGLFPFWEVYDTPSTFGAQRGREVHFRPFGSLEHHDPGASRLRLLYPLIDYHREEKQTRLAVLPLYRHRSRLLDEGGREVDWMVFPFLFGGSDPREGGYFAFFPFGGKLRGLLGQDEIDFALFPIYWHMRSKGRHSLHVLWPFINTVWGDGWSGGRFWPFYGSYLWQTEDGTPRSRRRMILWPFYIRGEERLETMPTTIFFTFPFYGVRENELSRTETYLWPFFVVHHNKKKGSDLAGGFLFPFRAGQADPETDQLDIWPFWGRKASRPDPSSRLQRQRYRQYVLWPIHRYDWARDELGETTRRWALPFLWKFSRTEWDPPSREVSWTLWPLVRYRARGGRVELDFPSPLWLLRTEYQRAYGRLFALFRYRRAPERSGWEVLYGALRWLREGPATSLSLLGGFLEIGARDGSLRLRILYVPWW